MTNLSLAETRVRIHTDNHSTLGCRVEVSEALRPPSGEASGELSAGQGKSIRRAGPDP